MSIPYKKKDELLYPKMTEYPDNKPLGKYGKLAVAYLEEVNPTEHELKLMTGTLMTYGHQMDDKAWNLYQKLMKEQLEKNPVPATQDVEKRAQHINKMKMQVEEIVIHEVIHQN
uniref:TnpV protein n=1 Tax=Carnobacterium maltaromaticum TaxID=2751 RepID=UPI0038FD1113